MPRASVCPIIPTPCRQAAPALQGLQEGSVVRAELSQNHQVYRGGFQSRVCCSWEGIGSPRGAGPAPTPALSLTVHAPVSPSVDRCPPFLRGVPPPLPPKVCMPLLPSCASCTHVPSYSRTLVSLLHYLQGTCGRSEPLPPRPSLSMTLGPGTITQATGSAAGGHLFKSRGSAFQKRTPWLGNFL